MFHECNGLGHEQISAGVFSYFSAAVIFLLILHQEKVRTLYLSVLDKQKNKLIFDYDSNPSLKLPLLILNSTFSRWMKQLELFGAPGTIRRSAAA